jgi:hypothetical protein
MEPLADVDAVGLDTQLSPVDQASGYRWYGLLTHDGSPPTPVAA